MRSVYNRTQIFINHESLNKKKGGYCKKRKSRNGSYIILFFSVVLLWHCQYSFCQNDESFYLALVHRLWLGERLVIDEWHPVQFYSPILLPFYSLFRLFSKDGTGSILFFRVLYISFSFLVSWALYHRLQKQYGNWVGTASALILLLYSRANIMGASYYNIMMQCVVATWLLALEAYDSNSNITFILLSLFSGIALSCAVLCNPFFAPFTFVTFLRLIVSGKRMRRLACLMLISIIVCALWYIILLIKGYSINELTQGLRFVLLDPSHVESLKDKAKRLLIQSRNVFDLSIIVIPIVMTMAFNLFERYKHVLRVAQLGYGAFALCMCIYSLIKSINSICDVELVVMAIILFPITVMNLKTDKSLAMLYLNGIAVAIAFFFGSNTTLDAMTTGFCIMTIVGIPSIAAYLAHISHDKPPRIFKYSICCAVALLLVAMGLHRFVGIYRDSSPERLTSRLESGPAAGLYTRVEEVREYQSILEGINDLYTENSGSNVLFARWLPWAYAVTDWNYGTPTAWNMSDERTESYYLLHPRKQPQYIFEFSDSVGAWERAPFNNHSANSKPNQSLAEGSYAHFVHEVGMIVKRTEYYTVYQINEIWEGN